jgi:hypothetical protein
MIDELVHDALDAQVERPTPERTDAAWARIEAAGSLGRRRRQRRTAGALAAAVMAVGVIVAVVVSQGSPSSEKVATSPTTGAPVEPATGPDVAPPPAPSVPEPLWQSTRLRPGFVGESWSGARTAGDGRDLVLTTSGCHDRFGAVVQDLGDRVSVELAVSDGPHLDCLMPEQVRVRLPRALAGRPLVDGPSSPAAPPSGWPLNGATLLVPHILPTSVRFQSEGLLNSFTSAGPSISYRPSSWQACYQADPPPPGPGEKTATTSASRCVFSGDRPMVTTAQSSDADAALAGGILSADALRPIFTRGRPGVAYFVSGPSSPRQGQIQIPAPVAGGVDGHPASLVSTGLHDVVVWTDGTTWFTVATPHGVGGVSSQELVTIAQSMRPVG